jgi:hypothetical protein
MALEHYKFKQFLRTIKDGLDFIVTPEIIGNVQTYKTDKIPTWNQIRLACHKNNMSMNMRYCRKLFASSLHHCNIPDFLIELLQGRCPRSILLQHYVVPKPSFRDDVLQAIQQLKQELEVLLC